MPRHIPRSHLSKLFISGFVDGEQKAACGSASEKILSRGIFLKTVDRCQRCDRIANGEPATTGRKAKDSVKRSIVLSGLSIDALNWLDQLAAEGKLGETIGGLVNEKLGEIKS